MKRERLYECLFHCESQPTYLVFPSCPLRLESDISRVYAVRGLAGDGC